MAAMELVPRRWRHALADGIRHARAAGLERLAESARRSMPATRPAE